MRTVIAALLLLAATACSADQPPEIVDYSLQGRPLRLLLADNPSRWSRGLSGELPPGSYDGMLFRFPTARYRKFWNLETRVPLTLYWLDGSQLIGESRLPAASPGKRPVTVSSPGPVDGVVELIQPPPAPQAGLPLELPP